MDKKMYLGIGSIIFGIGVMLVPFVKEAGEDQRQQKIMMQWWQEMRQSEGGEETLKIESNVENDVESNAESNIGNIAESNVGSNAENDAGTNAEKATGIGENLDDVVGILRIPAIGLENPVLKGSTKQNLNLSVATVEPTGTPGVDGNFVIAGHNSRTYGRHFNRLAELKNGDELFVDTEGGNYAYMVTDVYVVEAEDVWVLDDTIDGAEITLITCYYPKEGKPQRLVVKGILQ